MKKKILYLLCVVLFVVSMVSLAACTDRNGENPPIVDNGGGTVDENYQGSTIPVDGEKYNASSVYAEITITAGSNTLNAILFDNKTARAVADMLRLRCQRGILHPILRERSTCPEVLHISRTNRRK